MKLTKLKDITTIYSYAQFGNRASSQWGINGSKCHCKRSVVHLLTCQHRTKHFDHSDDI